MPRKPKPNAVVANRVMAARGDDTQPVFAKLIGLSVRVLRSYERAQEPVPDEVLERIAKARAIDLDWLAGRRAKPAKPEQAPPQVTRPVVAERRGPRSKISQELIDQVAGDIRIGIYAAQAARRAGISKSTYWGWRTRGEELRARMERGAELTPEEQLLVAFVDAMEMADADCEGDAVVILRGHTALSPHASIEFLARRFPARWGAKQEIKHTGTPPGGGGGGPVISLRGMPREDLDAMEKMLERQIERNRQATAAQGAPDGSTTPKPATP